MIHELKHTSNTIVAFQLSESITSEEFDKVVAPSVYELIVRADALNILFVLDESVIDFRFVSWLEDSLIKTHNVEKWSRIAIVTHIREKSIVDKTFPEFAHVESKLFSPTEFDTAVAWASSPVAPSQEQLFQEEDDHRD